MCGHSYFFPVVLTIPVYICCNPAFMTAKSNKGYIILNTDLCVVVLGPLNAIKEITEIGFDWNVVLVWLQLFVEEFIILRVLLQDDRVSTQQVRKTVRSHCTINVHLVLVLTTTNIFFKSQHKLSLRC